MKQRDRVRGVGLLCCHFTRNVAYYQAGWVDDSFVSSDDFWRNANSNFLDISVLEWHKLFGEWNGKHHWRKVVPEPDTFLTALWEDIDVTEDAFNTHCKEMKTYRDKFVAHLDNERRMQIPRLTIAVDSVLFLYDIILNEYQDFLPDAPANLRSYYEERLEHGRRRYPNTT
jgi:hypothetical protein